jgi:hypothetical protein
MINNPINIIDGIYCSFTYKNNTIVLGNSIGGYKTLSGDHVGKTVSYLVRDGKNNNWEIGVGEVQNTENGLSVNRINVLSSSNNDQAVNFTNPQDPSFCIIPNQYNFHTGFNNLIVKNANFTIDKIKTTYYVDTTNDDVIATLPSCVDTQGLIIEIKLIDSNNLLLINAQQNETIDNNAQLLLSSDKKYTRLISTGSGWTELLNVTDNSMLPLSIGAAGQPGGNPNSLQYNAVSGFDGLSAYYVSPGLLLGGSGINSANIILPLSGNNNVIFNNLKTSGNFIVNGIQNKNMLFDSDGRLGLNMPSGQRPASALHINNNNCLEGIRLDNKNNCSPATLTLFHKPSTVPAVNSIASVINLAGKDSVSQQVNYVQLKSKILNSTIGNTKGEFVVGVENAGQLKDVLSINSDRMLLSYGSNIFEISSSGTNISGLIKLSNLDLDGGVIVFSGLSSDNSPVVTRTLTPTVTLTSTPTRTPTPTPTRI